GPWHFPLSALNELGWGRIKEGHTLWLQIGAELGFPGFTFLLLFYGLGLIHLWPLTKEKTPVSDPWIRHIARMVITSTVGFAVAAQFISLWALEIPYYVMLVGAATIKLATAGVAEGGRTCCVFRKPIRAVPCRQFQGHDS